MVDKKRVAVLALIACLMMGILVSVVQGANSKKEYGFSLPGENDEYIKGTFKTVRHIDRYHWENHNGETASIQENLTEIKEYLFSESAETSNNDRLTFYDEFIDSCLKYPTNGCIWDDSYDNANITVLDNTYCGILRLNVNWNGWARVSFDTDNIPFYPSRNLAYASYLNLSGPWNTNLSFGLGDGLQFIYRYEWGPNLTVDLNGTYQDTGIPIDENWHLFEIKANPNSVEFYRDSSLIYEFTNGIPDNGYWPSYRVESHISKTQLNIDYIEVSQSRF